jgi:hypothetical protein
MSRLQQLVPACARGQNRPGGKLGGKNKDLRGLKTLIQPHINLMSPILDFSLNAFKQGFVAFNSRMFPLALLELATFHRTTRPSNRFVGAAGRRTSLAAATMRGPPLRKRR